MNTTEKKLDYNQYLLSKEWSIKRKEAFKLFKRKCQRCLNTKKLHVHHKTYKRFKKENVETDLAILCVPCHSLYHRKYKYAEISTTEIFITSFEIKNKGVPKRFLSKEERVERHVQRVALKRIRKQKSKEVREMFKKVKLPQPLRGIKNEGKIRKYMKMVSQEIHNPSKMKIPELLNLD